ncbi:MAG TPA: hypothetical protein VFP68_01540 [Burkholderiaceae bacterium]|nr:hypothetical protein [Burkholderiaceae bacterium]
MNAPAVASSQAAAPTNQWEIDFKRMIALSGLVPSIGDLPLELRDSTVNTVVRIRPQAYATEVVRGFAAGIDSLNGKQIDKFLAYALSVNPQSVQSSFLAPLTSKLPRLNPAQRDRIVGTMRSFFRDTDKVPILAALGEHVGLLNRKDREFVIVCAIRTAEDGRALAGLGAGMAHLGDDIPRVLESAMHIVSEEGKAVALSGLAAGLGHLSDPQVKSLFECAQRIVDESRKARALAGFGAGVRHVCDESRRLELVTRLMDTATSMNSESSKALALDGLSVAIPEMNSEQRALLIAQLDAFEDESCMQRLLSALGREMPHLNAQQRHMILTKTAELSDPAQLGQAMLNVMPHAIPYLSEEQCKAQIQRAAALGNFASFGLRGIAAGIGRMGEELDSHDTEEEWRALLERRHRLEDLVLSLPFKLERRANVGAWTAAEIRGQ